MLSKKSFSALAVTSLLAISSAYAVTPGVYLGAGLGWSSLNTPSNWLDRRFQSQSSENSGLGGRFFGGYNFNEYLGVELGFSQYAESSYEFSQRYGDYSRSGKATYNMRALDLIGKAYLPLSDTGVSVYALGGVAEAFVKAKASEAFTGFQPDEKQDPVSTSYHKLRPKFGVGVNYAINSNVSANFEVSRIQGEGNFKTSDKPVANADMAAVTFTYSLG